MAVEQLVIDETTRDKLDIADVARQLWALDCQSCGRALGGEPPALVVHDMLSFGAAALHHSHCRTPQWQDQGAFNIVSGPNLTYFTNAFLIPMTPDGGASHAMVPLVLVNPMLEQVMLKPREDGQGGWRVSSMEVFGQLGLVPLGPRLSMAPLPGSRARLSGEDLSITLDDPAGGPWTTTVTSSLFTDAVRETGGVMVGLTTALNPAEVTEVGQLAGAVEAGEVALGMTALRA